MLQYDLALIFPVVSRAVGFHGVGARSVLKGEEGRINALYEP